MRRKIDSAAESGGAGGIRRALKIWLPVLVLECLVLFLSSRPRLHVPGAVPHMDKAAHFAEYALLGWLLHRAFRLSGVGRMRGWLAVVLLLGGLSAGDEWLQGHVPGRESSPLDWLADLAGGLTGAGVDTWRRLRAGRRTSPPPVAVAGTEG